MRRRLAVPQLRGRGRGVRAAAVPSASGDVLGRDVFARARGRLAVWGCGAAAEDVAEGGQAERAADESC